MKQLAALLILIVGIISGCAQQQVEESRSVFYPPPPVLPRIQYLHTIVTESDIGLEQSEFDKFLLGPEIEFIGVIRPYDVSAGPGKIYVIDRLYNQVFYFDLKQRSLKILEDTDHPSGTIGYAGGIWVAEDGSQYIADIERKQILVFGPDNRYVGAYGDGTVFEKPVDVAVRDDRIYVCDYKKHAVLILDKDTGKVVQEIGGPGPEEQNLKRPTHVTLDDRGLVYVTDSFNFKIKQYSPDGEYLRSFGGVGDSLGKFARPKGVAVDRQGRVFAVDAAAELVQIFNSEGQLLLFFGGPGTKIENMWLPAGIAIDYDNVELFSNYADKDFKVEYLIYVANMAGPGRTNVYGFGTWTGDERRLDQMGEEIEAETVNSDEGGDGNGNQVGQ